MRKVNFGNNFTTTISGFFQYDYGQIIDVYNIGTNIENLQFEFIQDGQQITVLGTYNEETDSYTLRIPDSFLQNTSDILAYIYYEDPDMGQTIKILIVKITPREKYESIPDPQHHSIVEQILAELEHLQEEIDKKADKTEIPDISGLATKTELGNLSDSIGQTLSAFGQGLNSTNNRVSTLETSKADKATTYTKSEVYSKEEIDEMLGNIQTALEAIRNN